MLDSALFANSQACLKAYFMYILFFFYVSFLFQNSTLLCWQNRILATCCIVSKLLFCRQFCRQSTCDESTAQYPFMQGAIRSIKRESIITSFIIRGWSAWCVRLDWLKWLSRSVCAIIAGIRCAFADPFLAYLHSEKGASLAVLLRMAKAYELFGTVSWNQRPLLLNGGVCLGY